MLYVGLDYHTKSSYVSIFDESNEEIFESRMNSQSELPKFLSSLPDSKVLFEAGYGWPRLEKFLEDVDVELTMCHPEANRRIAMDRRKSDRRDARNLAVYLKTGAYREAYMPGAEIRDQRQLVRGRIYTKRKTTMLKNQIHSLLAYAGIPKESMDIFAKKNRWYLETVELPASTREVLKLNLEALDLFNEQLKLLNRRIIELNQNDHRARLLRTIPGVGNLTARVLLAEIGEVRRFKTDKALACHAGLTPKQRQSGESKFTMGITKEGSAHIRFVMVQAAWIAIRRDKSLREFYDRLALKSGTGVAICAVARKMIVAVWHILTKEIPFKARKPECLGKPGVARGKSARKSG